MYVFQFGTYAATLLKNPGLACFTSVRFKLEMTPEQKKKSYCKKCNIFRWDGVYHCPYCDVCIEDFDHHCPWSSKCISKGNMVPFWLLVASTFLLIFYLMAMTMYMVNSWEE